MANESIWDLANLKQIQTGFDPLVQSAKIPADLAQELGQMQLKAGIARSLQEQKDAADYRRSMALGRLTMDRYAEMAKAQDARQAALLEAQDARQEAKFRLQETAELNKRLGGLNIPRLKGESDTDYNIRAAGLLRERMVDDVSGLQEDIDDLTNEHQGLGARLGRKYENDVLKKARESLGMTKDNAVLLQSEKGFGDRWNAALAKARELVQKDPSLIARMKTIEKQLDRKELLIDDKEKTYHAIGGTSRAMRDARLGPRLQAPAVPAGADIGDLGRLMPTEPTEYVPAPGVGPADLAAVPGGGGGRPARVPRGAAAVSGLAGGVGGEEEYDQFGFPMPPAPAKTAATTAATVAAAAVPQTGRNVVKGDLPDWMRQDLPRWLRHPLQTWNEAAERQLEPAATAFHNFMARRMGGATIEDPRSLADAIRLAPGSEAPGLTSEQVDNAIATAQSAVDAARPTAPPVHWWSQPGFRSSVPAEPSGLTPQQVDDAINALSGAAPAGANAFSRSAGGSFGSRTGAAPRFALPNTGLTDIVTGLVGGNPQRANAGAATLHSLLGGTAVDALAPSTVTPPMEVAVIPGQRPAPVAPSVLRRLPPIPSAPQWTVDDIAPRLGPIGRQVSPSVLQWLSSNPQIYPELGALSGRVF